MSKTFGGSVGELNELPEENNEIIRRHLAGEASEEEIEEFKKRILRWLGKVLPRYTLGAGGILAVLRWATWNPARLLKLLEQWHPLTEFFGWFALGGMAIYMAYQANRISRQQTELARRQTELLDRQQKLAEDQLRPRLRLRVGVKNLGSDIGSVSHYWIENTGGEMENFSVWAGSALIATLRRTQGTEIETLAFPVGFYVRPRYTQESKGVAYESQALDWDYKKKAWFSMNSRLVDTSKILDQRFRDKGGFCRITLRHFVITFAKGAFGGTDKAAFEVPENFSEMTEGPSRLPDKEGEAALTAITSSIQGLNLRNVAETAELISTLKIDPGQINTYVSWSATMFRLGEALDALDKTRWQN